MPYAEVRERAAFRRARDSHCVDPGRTPERGRVIILPRRVDDPPELGHGLTPIWTVSPRKAYVCRRDLSAQRGSSSERLERLRRVFYFPGTFRVRVRKRTRGKQPAWL